MWVGQRRAYYGSALLQPTVAAQPSGKPQQQTLCGRYAARYQAGACLPDGTVRASFRSGSAVVQGLANCDMLRPASPVVRRNQGTRRRDRDMTQSKSRLTWVRWIALAVIGAGLPVAACQRSLSGPVDVPVLADVVTIAFYVLALACLGVSLALSLPRSA